MSEAVSKYLVSMQFISYHLPKCAPIETHVQITMSKKSTDGSQCGIFPGIGPEAKSNPATLYFKNQMWDNPEKVVFIPIRLRNKKVG